MTPDRFSLSVCTEDVKAISKSPGIGTKTAQRIILELKDKISKDMILKQLWKILFLKI
jgi:Holliday junction DNA helicase RuvA